MATAAPLNYGSAHFEILREKNTAHQARDLRARVRHALQRGERHVVVDCTAWNQLDLSMLSALIQCASTCREHGASFEIANISNELRADVRALQLNERLGLIG